MSSADHRGIPPGIAVVIAAIIGALGVIAGAVLGARSQTIQVIVGAPTPTVVAVYVVTATKSASDANVLQLTLTPLPTQQPSEAPTAVAAAPTQVSVPTTNAGANCTPRGGTVDLAGQVASDIPGFLGTCPNSCLYFSESLCVALIYAKISPVEKKIPIAIATLGDWRKALDRLVR